MKMFNGLAAGILFALAANAAFGYPYKPVQYIIPFAPGGESDITARMQAIVFQAKYNQQMIVINRTGAGGALVWSQLNTMTPDGYTVAGINLPHIFLQPLEGNVNYKTEDMTPVFFFQYTADAVVVIESSPFKTIQDLVAAAKANPETWAAREAICTATFTSPKIRSSSARGMTWCALSR